GRAPLPALRVLRGQADLPEGELVPAHPAQRDRGSGRAPPTVCRPPDDRDVGPDVPLAATLPNRLCRCPACRGQSASPPRRRSSVRRSQRLISRIAAVRIKEFPAKRAWFVVPSHPPSFLLMSR